MTIFRYKLIFKLRSCQLFVRLQNWRSKRCRLSTSSNSMYTQLPSTSSGRFLHPQPAGAPCRGDRDPRNMGREGTFSLNFPWKA